MNKLLSLSLMAAILLPTFMKAEENSPSGNFKEEILTQKYNCTMTMMNGQNGRVLMDNALGWHNSLFGNKNLNALNETSFNKGAWVDFKWAQKVEITRIELYVLASYETVFKKMVLPKSIKLLVLNDNGVLEKVIAGRDEIIWEKVPKWNGKDEDALCYTISGLGIKTNELRFVWGTGGNAWCFLGDVRIYGTPVD